MSKTIDSVATFVAPEIEAALWFPTRSIELLKRENVAPKPDNEVARGRAARWGFGALCTFVVTSELYKGMGNLVPAARIAQGVTQELLMVYGHVPFGFKDLQRTLKAKGHDISSIRGADGELCEYRTFEAAWRQGITNADEPAKNDYILVIADSEWVGRSIWQGLKFLMLNPENDGTVEQILRYSYSGPGGGLKIEHLQSRAGEDFFCERLRCATSIVQLNVSLALRKALVSIIEQREANG